MLIGIFGSLGIRIEGNFIGTDTSGTEERGNGSDGVLIREGSGGDVGGSHVVGDGSPASRNVISGNGRDGVVIFNGSSNNKVKGNYIGTDRDGTGDLTNDDMGNNGSGVAIVEANNNEVGSATAGSGNVISSNDSDGVLVTSGSSGNKVLGNRIGTDSSGTKDLGNFSNGVLVIGAPNNTFGDGTTGGANIIAFNGRAGVDIDVSGGAPNGANGNRVLSNSIFSNDGLGIGLGGSFTPTPNDVGDADIGPNTLQNFPVLSSAKIGRKGTTIGGKLNSTPNTPFRVQFFSNPSGTDEGKTFIGEKIMSTDTSGNTTFSFKPAAKVAKGQYITATATAPGANTSEFSAPKKVVRKR